MAAIIVKVDTKLVIENNNEAGPSVGTFSEYINTAHPGTGNKIVGWQYDNRTWPSDDNDYTTTIAPMTDIDLSLVPSIDFQSGIGAADDCLVESIMPELNSGFISNWFPNVNNGTWFDHELDYYLYSDDARSQYALFASLMSGLSYIDTLEFPKDGVPILCRTYMWDDTQQEYLTYINYQKKVYFTGLKPTPTSARLATWNNNTQQIITANIDTTKNEYIILYGGYTFPRIVFNKDVSNVIGHTVSTGADLSALEEVGITDGTIKMLFHTKYSPIDKTQAVEVFTYTTDITVYQQWTTRLNTSLTHAGHECIVDTDLGVIQFGDTGAGDVIPPANAHVLIRYTYTVEAIYEPTTSTGLNLATNDDADINPMVRTNNRGFIIIDRVEDIPANIVLYADEPLIATNDYGPVNIGNTLIPVHALVTTKTGIPIEHLKVTFNLLDSPLVGNFTNGNATIHSYTNNLGIATSYYNAPTSIDDVSEFIPIGQYSTSGGNTILTTSTIKISPTLRDIFLYSVWQDDPYQGINIGDNTVLEAGGITAELDTWYKTEFFVPELIYGPTGLDIGTGNPTTPLASGATWWEQRRRLLQHILTPTSYNRALRNGRKQIIATWNASALDPHFNETGAFVPLTPTSVVNSGPVANAIHYNGVVLTAPGTGELDGYLVISPTSATIQASVYDAYADKTIFSNIITIELKVANELNGTVYIDDFNTIPASTLSYMLNSGDNGKILPLGFKIRQTGVTLASAIQRVTYLDINQPAMLTMTFNVDQIVS